MASQPARHLGSIIFSACLSTLLPVALYASQVRGVVRDQSGAVVASAAVEFRSGRIHITTRSDSSGAFLLQAAPEAGTLTVSAPGFASVAMPCCESGQSVIVELKPATVGDTIIVTAERRPTRMAATAANTLLLNAEELNTRTAPTLDDALRQVPGFTLFRRGSSLTANPTTQGASVRGLGANGAGRVLVLQDGIPLNDPFGGWVYWDRTPRLALDRAEVLRGGGSNLYGSAALAGVVELFTPPPANLMTFQISGGGLAQRDAEAYLSRRLGPWTLTGTAESFGDNGAFVVTPEDRGLVDTPAELHYANTSLRVDRSLSKDLRLFASGSLFAEKRNNGTVLQVNSTHLGQFTTGLDLDGKNSALRVRFYGTGQKLHQSFSSISGDRNSENLVRWQTVPSAELGFSTQWTTTFPRLQLTAGVDGRLIHGESDETIFIRGAANALSLSGGTDRIIGGFAEVSGTPIRRLRVSLGARADEWSTDNSFSRTLSLANAATVINPVENHHELVFSPRVGAVYDLPASFQAILSVYGGFRAPTLNELYRSFRVGNIVTQANSQLGAEHLAGGEAGLRYVRSRYMLSGTFFRDRVDDPIANVTQSETPDLIVRQRQNMGALEAKGADIDGLLVLWRFQLRAGYEYVHSIVISFSAVPGLVGKAVPQTPAHVFTESLSYMAPRGFTLEVMGRASSSQFDDDQNQFSLAPYSTFGMSLSKRLRSATLFAAAANLFDSRIETAATPVISVAPGRLITAGLRLHFGAR